LHLAVTGREWDQIPEQREAKTYRTGAALSRPQRNYPIDFGILISACRVRYVSPLEDETAKELLAVLLALSN